MLAFPSFRQNFIVQSKGEGIVSRGYLKHLYGWTLLLPCGG
jgi:hypothetical protein